MKDCPVCGARCFDDMETCYGCLHRFAGKGDVEKKPSEQIAQALSVSTLLKMPSVEGEPPACSDGRQESEPSCRLSGIGNSADEKNLGFRPKHGKRLRELEPSAVECARIGVERKRDCGEVIPVRSEERNAGGEWVFRIGVPEERDELVIRLERAAR